MPRLGGWKDEGGRVKEWGEGERMREGGWVGGWKEEWERWRGEGWEEEDESSRGGR